MDDFSTFEKLDGNQPCCAYLMTEKCASLLVSVAGSHLHARQRNG